MSDCVDVMRAHRTGLRSRHRSPVVNSTICLRRRPWYKSRHMVVQATSQMPECGGVTHDRPGGEESLAWALQIRFARRTIQSDTLCRFGGRRGR
jgi:hypothetical protein